MISASHNPYYDNGIKLINSKGEKMDEETILKVEDYIDGKIEVPMAVRDQIGCTVDYSAGRNRYIGYLISLATRSYKNIKVGLDCANGSSWMIAKSVFDALGAKTYVINTKFIKGFIKSEVRHDCCYYSVVAKCTFFFEIASINV